MRRRGRLARLVRRALALVDARRVPRGAGIAASVLLVLASVAYGLVKGGHAPMMIAELKDVRDAAANAVGFPIAAVAVVGAREVGEQEVLRAAGITEHTSLLFLDVNDARAALRGNPWIAEATIQKLYPDHLQINLVEREAFALWQRDGKVFVIAADGTLLAPLTDQRFAALPLIVGAGAGARAQAFLTVLDRFPTLRAEMRAAILVAERRWNLKLKNGIDVRLPQDDVAQALATLTTLAERDKLLSRDIVAVDLRLPDRVMVRLSEEAAKDRENAIKERDKKVRRGGNA